MGANTEPMRYRKFVMSSMGQIIAAAVPITVTIMAAVLPLIFFEMVSQETPAEKASKNVVVTVENTTITSAAMLSPAFSIICAMSVWPVNMDAPMPMRYIQQLTRP